MANITFGRGNLPINIWIRIILSHVRRKKGNNEEAAIDLVKATISNAGSRRSRVIAPLLGEHMPPVLNGLPYQNVSFLLALGNEERNLGNPDAAEKHYEQARCILSNMLPKEAKKPLHALERRELAVMRRSLPSRKTKRLIDDAEDDGDRYGIRTTLYYVAYDCVKKNEYVQAQDHFSEGLCSQESGDVISWWHKMAGWLGLGVTLYFSDPNQFVDALRSCLMAEYVSAMLNLRVDVTRGISEQLLRPRTLLSPPAIIRRIGEEKHIPKEKMEEIRHTALIESGLQKELLAELSGESWLRTRRMI